MKSHYDHTVTMKEAVRIGEAAAKYNFRQAVDKFTREDENKHLSIGSLNLRQFLTVVFGFGEKRIRRAMRALGELTCEVHGMIKDGIFNDIYDKRLKGRGLWEAYEEFANGKCRQIGDSDYYEPIPEDEVSEE